MDFVRFKYCCMGNWKSRTVFHEHSVIMCALYTNNCQLPIHAHTYAQIFPDSVPVARELFLTL